MNPKKTKSGSYHVTAYIGKRNGKKIYKSITAPTKRECLLRAAEYARHNPTDGSNLTIKQALDDYIDSKEKVLSPSTITGYRRISKNYFNDIQNIRIDDFGNYELQKFIGSLNVSPKTVRNIYGLLRSALRMFSDRDYNVSLPEKVEPVRTVATEEDIKLLLDAADPELRKAIILGTCSLRRGEVSALKYEDIGTDTLHIHADIVKNQYGEYIYKDSAKTPASTRYVSVSDDIIKALGTGTGYVVKIANPDIITKRFTRLRDKLGINVSFHSLRRFYASISHALGIPNEFIQKQGGWSNESVMIKSYRQTLSTHEKEYSKKLSSAMSKIIV